MNEQRSAEEQGSEPSELHSLGPAQLRAVLQHYGDALKARRKGLDRLNVYPVPDGDTGTNMSLTVQSVLAELKTAASNDMSAVAAAIGRGAIMGARGNSGAILAQVLRGIAETAKDCVSLGPEDVARALGRAKVSAYESVLKPVEGTILTVVSAAAAAAHEQAGHGADLKDQLFHVRKAAADALVRTPELLPVLKNAGVVDAGGSGFLLFVDALRYVATGEPIPGGDDSTEADSADDFVLGVEAGHDDISGLRYEVMFLLEGNDSGIDGLRSKWADVGDSIVIVGGDGLYNCHIHSDDIGASIEMALDYGRPTKIRVTDLLEQAREVSSGEIVETAGVAVLSGVGLAKVFRSFGLQQIVSGGQSANPSVSELLSAIERSPSDNVVVLPNNKNVHSAARQAAEMSTKSVKVIETASFVEGLVAAMSYDSSAGLSANAEEMASAIGNVAYGEITRAVRSSTHDGRVIDEGDWLGLDRSGVLVVGQSADSVLQMLFEKLNTSDHEIITLIKGDQADANVMASFRDWLAKAHPGLEVEEIDGGQPLYPYLIGLE